MDEKEVKVSIEKIERLINSADKFNEMSFRMVLEGLIHKVGEEAEYFLVHYINEDKVDTATRINIVRIAGYIQSPHFLIPLKKVIDMDEDINLRKEAIISVSKYNDRMALNILNQALVNIKNPLLLETINTEIAKIKRNNPVIALLPRFLEGEKNLKDFNVTLGILKRIVTPADAPVFVAYLNCGQRIIEDGAFEILCFAADERLQEHILLFFQDRFNELYRNVSAQEKKEISGEHQGEDKNQQLYLLVLKIKSYFSRNPSLIDQHMENLGTQLLYIKEKRIQNLFISIICLSQQPSAISFMGELYDKEPALRGAIISGYYGNEAAVDLLFEKYQTADGNLIELLIRSLLNCRKGLDYFYLYFSPLNVKIKEIIVNCLPYGGKHDLSAFFKLIFQSTQFKLKALLLAKVKNYFEFSIQDILFDPAVEKEFSPLENEYLDTITQLFPITSIKKLMEKIGSMDLSFSKARKYLQKLKETVVPGFALIIKDKNFITQLFNQVIQFNNADMGAMFLSILKEIKTFDLHTYYNFHESLGLFTAQRERKISPQEVEELRKARRNLNDLYYDLQQIEEGLKMLNRLFSRKEMDFELMNDFLNRHSLCAALHIRRLIQMIKDHLLAAKIDVQRQWIQLFYQYPMIGIQIKDVILEKAHFQKSPLSALLKKLYNSLPLEPYKLVINLNNPSYTAVLKEQSHELIPMIPVSTLGEDWQEGDILLCDTETLREFILKQTLPSKKLFLLLDKQSEFSSFKSYNARTLIKPLSAHRVFKEVLKEVFL